MSRTTPTPPSGSDPIKGAPPSGRVNSSPNQGTGPIEGTQASDEFVIASEVQKVANPPSAPVRESFSGTVNRFLERRISDNNVLNRALEILGIESHDEPGSSINTSA